MGSNRFSDLKLRNFTTGQEVSLKSLWADQHVAVIFFRRFGCVFCRLWAKELSEITPILRRHNIKMIGVGFEDIGAKEFINSKYFDGDIYITVEKDTYSKLGFKRLGYFGVLTSLVRKESREAVSKSKAMNLSMDIKGDGLQNGGAMFFEKGGKVLEFYVQEEAKASFSNYNILKLYNLEQEYKTSESSGDGKSCKGKTSRILANLKKNCSDLMRPSKMLPCRSEGVSFSDVPRRVTASVNIKQIFDISE